MDNPDDRDSSAQAETPSPDPFEAGTFRLEVTTGAGRAEEIAPAELPFTIGRSPECGLELDDRKASRVHAELCVDRGRLLLRDLESRNGVLLTHEGSSAGTRIDGAAPLESGDHFRIGQTRIGVSFEAARRESDAPIPSRKLARSRRRRLVAAIAPVVLLLGGTYAGWRIITSDSGDTTGRTRVELILSDEATGDLDWLRARVAAAEEVDRDLLLAAHALCRKHAELAPETANPFEELRALLKDRHELEIESRLQELSARHRELLNEKRYGEALDYTRREAEILKRENVQRRETAQKILERTERAALNAYRELTAEVAQLEAVDYVDEARKLFAWAGESFAGSDEYGEKLSAALAAFEERVVGRRHRAELALAREKDRETRTPGTKAERVLPLVVGLSGLLAPAVNAGALEERSYRLGESEGSPMAIDAGGWLRLRGAAGQTLRISFERIPAAVQLDMAGDALQGDAILEAAEYGFAHDLNAEAGSLLHRFLTREAGERASHQNKIDELLARVRGLPAIPEGGFKYHRDHGWEDAAQIYERRAIARGTRLIQYLPGKSTNAGLKKTFDEILALIRDERLGQDGSRGIRHAVIEALADERRESVEKILARMQRGGLKRVRLAKIELDRRRRAALTLIRDTKRYTKSKGQAEVDAAVKAVEELWNSAGTFAVQLDRGSGLLAERVKLIDSSFFGELKHRPSREDEDSLQEVWNNIGRAIDLKSFALDHRDYLHYEYNRKVETYNAQLKDPDLDEGERKHVGVINDYREMLGLRRVFFDPRLGRACQKHSEAQNRAGRIWHSGPNGSPSSRARDEGFPGGVAENVAIGYSNPGDIWWRGWYRSCGHHRNVIGAGWNCMGYGYVGSVGTQNFATATPPF